MSPCPDCGVSGTCERCAAALAALRATIDTSDHSSNRVPMIVGGPNRHERRKREAAARKAGK